VEVKARFDEERNIEWARNLERAGVHVIYGIPRIKCHAKLCLVVRREGDMVRRYCHVGTGNYNAATAGLYTDVGLFTCDDALTEDVSDLFNHITGFGRQPSYRQLLVAPQHIRKGLLAEIERVTQAHRDGTPGRIVMKMNALIDGPIMKALYQASQAGVPIDLVVRSIVGITPGVPGISDNIRVRSVVGRFLEHSRIFSFRSGDHTRVWIGSADMMVRNLDHRIEAITPVDDPDCARDLELILATMLADTALAWSLGSDGRWTKVEPPPGTPGLSCQEEFMQRATERLAAIDV